MEQWKFLRTGNCIYKLIMSQELLEGERNSFGPRFIQTNRPSEGEKKLNVNRAVWRRITHAQSCHRVGEGHDSHRGQWHPFKPAVKMYEKHGITSMFSKRKSLNSRFNYLVWFRDKIAVKACSTNVKRISRPANRNLIQHRVKFIKFIFVS